MIDAPSPQPVEGTESWAPNKGDIIHVQIEEQWDEAKYVVLRNCGLEDMISGDTIVKAELLDSNGVRTGQIIKVKTREGRVGSGDHPVQPVLVVSHMNL